MSANNQPDGQIAEDTRLNLLYAVGAMLSEILIQTNDDDERQVVLSAISCVKTLARVLDDAEPFWKK